MSLSSVGAFFLYNSKYEEVAVNHADKLVFICEEQRDFTLKQYPNYEELVKKAVIYPLTYIPEWKMYSNLLDTPRVHNEVKQAVHLGRLYGLRKIDSFLEALKELNEEVPNLKDKIVFLEKQEFIYQPLNHRRHRLFIFYPSMSYIPLNR